MVAVPALPHPPIVYVPSPPPIVSTAPPLIRSPDFVPASYEVEVHGGGAPLWRGTMNVSTKGAASYSFVRSDAAQTECPRERYGRGSRTSLSINLGPLAKPDLRSVGVRVSWDRPGDDGPCAAFESTRSVSFQQALTLAPGETRTVSGDGGLTVRLRRVR